MKRFEFYIMLVTSALLVFVVVGQAVVIRDSQQTARELIGAQQYVGKAQQIEPILGQLLNRCLQASEKDPLIRDVIVRNGFQIRQNNPSTGAAAPTR